MRPYGGSTVKLIRSIYSDFTFLPWLFDTCPHSTFDSRQNRIEYISWLMGKVAVRSPSGLSTKHFLENCGGALLKKYNGSLLRVIESHWHVG